MPKYIYLPSWKSTLLAILHDKLYILIKIIAQECLILNSYCFFHFSLNCLFFTPFHTAVRVLRVNLDKVLSMCHKYKKISPEYIYKICHQFSYSYSYSYSYVVLLYRIMFCILDKEFNQGLSNDNIILLLLLFQNLPLLPPCLRFTRIVVLK